MGDVVGIVLAAGAGRRMGRPKALVRDARGGWLARAVTALREAGCAPVVVVLGAAADQAADLLPSGPDPLVCVVVAADWAEGMAASLRAGLAEAGKSTASAALVTLVDLPDLDARVHARVIAAAGGEPAVGVLAGQPASTEGAGAEAPTVPGAAGALARAAYQGVPGHPVLIGRDHWAAAARAAVGDRGARDLFASTPHRLVECADLATGRDVDEGGSSPG